MEAEVWGLIKRSHYLLGGLRLSRASIELDCKLLVDDVVDGYRNLIELDNILMRNNICTINL